jgi:hypothetical protein
MRKLNNENLKNEEIKVIKPFLESDSNKKTELPTNEKITENAEKTVLQLLTYVNNLSLVAASFCDKDLRKVKRC